MVRTNGGLRLPRFRATRPHGLHPAARQAPRPFLLDPSLEHVTLTRVDLLERAFHQRVAIHGGKTLHGYFRRTQLPSNRNRLATFPFPATGGGGSGRGGSSYHATTDHDNESGREPRPSARPWSASGTVRAVAPVADTQLVLPGSASVLNPGLGASVLNTGLGVSESRDLLRGVGHQYTRQSDAQSSWQSLRVGFPVLIHFYQVDKRIPVLGGSGFLIPQDSGFNRVRGWSGAWQGNQAGTMPI